MPALFVGLLYDAAVLDDAWKLVQDWTATERQTLRNDVPRTAIHTPFRAGKVAGHRQGNRGPWPGAASRAGELGEEQFLACLDETLRLDKTPAERWLDKYHGEWAGDVTRIFDEAEI